MSSSSLVNSAQFTSIERDWSVLATFRPMLTPWQPLRDCQYLKPQVRLDPRRAEVGNPLTQAVQWALAGRSC